MSLVQKFETPIVMQIEEALQAEQFRKLQELCMVFRGNGRFYKLAFTNLQLFAKSNLFINVRKICFVSENIIGQ